MENDNSYARYKNSECEPVGVWYPPWGPSVPWLWIWSRAAGRILGFRPSQMIWANLLVICPDKSRWAKSFPGKKPGTTDWAAAAARLIEGCLLCGIVEPPEGFNIRGPGRPRKHG
jgi:hypothetical protein